ncbi:hypothetical protein BU24DRAFT_491888 [Aaosphaeria arxii CBS 175.79]|uniref:Xylanolytic transcriptional activator regulatory domain-containing protein n=1 Tax=Aaosphaeria arxii CBS 175.79 TaxID=1450172 RepID=A0A6A5XSD4_9PLEO|nr:uncharacterized protein BU24DRAFT_491888 [Aaosphaeria arxii CBS 175.79]KAF2015671.1 hypothetical protein BU24DRAFT_491888 [Aaosphaeria arxii CBS 175.79]
MDDPHRGGSQSAQDSASITINPSDEDADEQSGEVWENELSESPFPKPTPFIRDVRTTKDQWLYISQSSSWSFTFRVAEMIRRTLQPEPTQDFRYLFDGDAYSLDWTNELPDQSSILQGVPPQDYAIYLLNAVKFNLCNILPFFDEDEFTKQTSKFYENPQETVKTSRIWYTQFLVVLSFGKAFVVPFQNRTTPPGFEFFSRAMALLPTIPDLQSEPIMAVELLALISLYMYCLDMRAAAYIHIGQAARLAMWCGLHKNVPTEVIGDDRARRYNNLWWSIYVMDRHISSASGCPKAVPEEDITAPLPTSTASSQRHVVYTLHVKVTRLVSKVIATVYIPDDVSDRTFLDRTRRLLKHLAGLARELEDTIHNELQSTVQLDLSAVTLITLSYHECAILATRPVLLSLFKRRLRNAQQRSTDQRPYSAGIKTLVETCAKSAAKIIDLLTVRLENNMIEAFLPFQLANLTSATIILQILPFVFSSHLDCSTLVDKAVAILDEMIARGNHIALNRKECLFYIRDLLDRLASRFQSRRGSPGEPSVQSEEQATLPLDYYPIPELPVEPESHFLVNSIPSYPMFPNEDFLASFGLSSDALDSVVNQVMFGTPLDLQGSWQDEDERTQLDLV